MISAFICSAMPKLIFGPGTIGRILGTDWADDSGSGLNGYAITNKKPFSLEAERAYRFTIGKDEIGLLNIVLLDGTAKSEACNQ